MSDAGDDYRESVAAALEEDGRDMLIFRRRTGAYDNATGSAEVTEEEFDAFGIVTAYTFREIDGTRVQRQDKKLILQGLGLQCTPQNGDRIEFGRYKFSVMDVEMLDVDDKPFAFIIQGRP